VQPEFDADRVDKTVVARQLAAMEKFDALAREFESLDGGAIAAGKRLVHFALCDSKTRAAKIDAIKLFAQLDQSFVASSGDVAYDGPHRLVDVLGNFPFHAKQRSEPVRKIAGGGVKADRHGCSS
jgi:hypothetical protein